MPDNKHITELTKAINQLTNALGVATIITASTLFLTLTICTLIITARRKGKP